MRLSLCVCASVYTYISMYKATMAARQAIVRSPRNFRARLMPVIYLFPNYFAAARGPLFSRLCFSWRTGANANFSADSRYFAVLCWWGCRISPTIYAGRLWRWLSASLVWDFSGDGFNVMNDFWNGGVLMWYMVFLSKHLSRLWISYISMNHRGLSDCVHFSGRKISLK